MKAVVVGGGVFGLGTALSLCERGWDVTVREAGTVPDPRAASTDISKLVRMDYGADAHYHDMMRTALPRWRAWNREESGLFHEDGVLFVTPRMDAGFEADSLALLRRDGVRHRAVDPAEYGWEGGSEAYIDEEAGWAPSGRVVAWMADRARAMGVEIREGEGGLSDADAVIVAAGTWSWRVLPELAALVRSTAQPVLHFSVDPGAFSPPRFLPWAFDISRTGWYGFPAQPDGTLKIANHGRGWDLDPDVPRVAPESVDGQFRSFLRDHLPAAADAPIRLRKLCFYADTPDGDFLVDRVPGRENVFVATGGSGHAFKFAPILGDCVADRVEGKENPWNHRFVWRVPAAGHEAARSESVI